jgi:hypothetical protein
MLIAMGHVILFEHANFHGAHKHIFEDYDNLNADDDTDFNDKTSSIVILDGRWEFFRHSGFSSKTGNTLGPGTYPNVRDHDIDNDAISSLRQV